MAAKRLIIMACSATKRQDAGLLPAIQRYDGPNYKTLRRFLADDPAEAAAIDIIILSALFGFVRGDTPLPYYDRRMTANRAVELRPQGRRRLAHWIDGVYCATLIHLGGDYLPALDLPAEMRARLGTVTYTTGGIGCRLGQFKQWLHGHKE